MNLANSIKLVPSLDAEEKKNSWDGYVLSHPEGRFCHLTGYRKVVEETYGYKPFYLVFERDGKILGVFPSFVCKSIIFGTKIVSQPFSEYGGMLADELTHNDYGEVFEARVSLYGKGRSI
jgi:hypothetical protein